MCPTPAAAHSILKAVQVWRPLKLVAGFLIVSSLLVCRQAAADSLAQLSQDFWLWRSQEQPVTSDDIPRLDRPQDWRPAWSASSLRDYSSKREAFQQRLANLRHDGLSVHELVDFYLVMSAINRVQWELEVLRAPERNPSFYVDQTLGAYLSLILPPPPFTSERSAAILRILDSIPTTLSDGRTNLDDARGPFTDLALAELQDAAPRLMRSVAALELLLVPDKREQVNVSAVRAGEALDEYAAWLKKRRPQLRNDTAVGKDGYLFFLHRVALLPYTPEQLLAYGRRDWANAITNEVLEERRSAGAIPLHLFADAKQQIEKEAADELSVRRFLREKDLLTISPSMPHWTFVPLPDYVEPFTDLGEADDFASPAHLERNGIRYIEPPSAKLGYFAKAMATDPRTLVVHEGVPGHYFQLMVSWHNADPRRRHYYDSGANEGIGFYAEGMMTAAGLFDDSPHSRELIWNFARLRALRVEADVRLALGSFTLQQAADYLAASVPMDSKTALEEASFFAATPGQAVSYLIGKVQIEDMLAEAKRSQGSHFDLHAFDDYLWTNGNVPLVLQSWELLGRTDGLERLGLQPR